MGYVVSDVRCYRIYDWHSWLNVQMDYIVYVLQVYLIFLTI